MKEKTIECVHFGICSGCVYNSCESPPELYDQAKKYFIDSWQIPLAFKQGHVRHYRSRAKLAVRAPDLIGLFKKSSHDVLSIPGCQVQHPSINHAVDELLQALRAAGLTAYDEENHKGDLRYVQCILERKTCKVQLTLVLNQKTASSSWYEFVKQLYKSNTWHSIWFNFNPKRTNTIFGKSWEKVAGVDYVWQKLAGYDFAFGPSHFGQANLEMFEEMLLDLQQKIIPESRVAELYAGMGIIGIALSKTASHITLSEVEKEAAHFFQLSLAKLSRAQQQKLTYVTCKAEEALDTIQGCDVCVVDPPRKGLGTSLIEKILKTPSLKQLVYISCDYTSLERDLSYIQNRFPNWKVASATSYLFFPGTNQIETVAFLENVRE